MLITVITDFFKHFTNNWTRYQDRASVDVTYTFRIKSESTFIFSYLTQQQLQLDPCLTSLQNDCNQWLRFFKKIHF